MLTPKELTEQIAQLSVAERILLAQDIWDSVAATPEEIPLSQEHCEELERRMEELEKNPQEGILWQDLRAMLKNRK